MKNRFPATLTEGFSFSLRRRARARVLFRFGTHFFLVRTHARGRERRAPERTDGRTTRAENASGVHTSRALQKKSSAYAEQTGPEEKQTKLKNKTKQIDTARVHGRTRFMRDGQCVRVCARRE